MNLINVSRMLLLLFIIPWLVVGNFLSIDIANTYIHVITWHQWRSVTYKQFYVQKSYPLSPMFEGDSADMCARKFPLMLMGGRANGPACAVFKVFGIIPLDISCAGKRT